MLKCSWNQINEIADEYFSESCIDDAKKTAKRNMLWLALFENCEETLRSSKFSSYTNPKNIRHLAFEDVMDIYIDSALKAIEKYKAELGASFSTFFLRIVFNNALKSAFDKAFPKIEDNKNDKRVKISSLQETYPDSDEVVSEIPVPDPTVIVDSEIIADQIFIELISLILNFYQHCTGRSANENRLLYYKLFYTDKSVEIIKTVDILALLEQHERDMLSAMDIRFLDYFVAGKPRMVRQIFHSRIKKYSELIDNGEQRELMLPLEKKFYVMFLQEVYEVMVSEPRLAVLNKEFIEYCCKECKIFNERLINK